jgi:two-component system response regulator DesR
MTSNLCRAAQGREPRRVLIADANPDVRAALGLLLGREQGLAIVSQVADEQGLLSCAVETQPHLALLEWELPGSRGLQTLSALRAGCPGLAIVVLSVRPESRDQVLASGLGAFVSKSDPPGCLVTAIRAALAAR